MPIDKRIFIAFPVSSAVVKAAMEWQKMVQKRYPFFRAKWVAAANLHVTLEFLGSITPSQLETVREVMLYQTKRVRPFLFETGLVNVFPTPRRAHTIVCEVTEKAAESASYLHKVVHEELVLRGISTDFKPWRPHVTMARTNGGVDLTLLQTLAVTKKKWRVSSVQLIESHTSSTDGARYTILNEYPLQ